MNTEILTPRNEAKIDKSFSFSPKVLSLLIVLLLFTSQISFAYDFEVDGIYYNITDTINKTVSVTSDDGNIKYSGNIIIPDSIFHNNKTFCVTSISPYAFGNCYGLTSIAIPQSITYIGYEAFIECLNLTSVYISNLEAWCNISFHSASSNPLYHAQHLYLQDTLLTDLIIPNTIIYLQNFAFYNCKQLVSVTIPSSTKYIGDGAFYKCSNLANIEFGDNLISIGKRAFSLCSGLTNIKLSNQLTHINEYAFSSCAKLSDVVIPNSVIFIGEHAFSICKGLINITIPNNISAISKYAFAHCENVATIISLNTQPPICDSRTFYGISITDCKLYIPNGTINSYRVAEGWKDFINIEEQGLSGMGNTSINIDDNPEYYDLKGIKVFKEKLTRGFYIKKTGSNKTKVFIP